MRYLLDTCIISELISKHPNPNVVSWVDSLDNEMIYLSVITLGEIIRGVEKLPDSARKTHLIHWLEDDLLVRFRDRIAIIDVPAIQEWGKLTARMESRGQKRPVIDSLIAATALQGGFILVTRNERDFEGTGVRLINPWR